MKRGSLALAVLLLIGGVLRVSGPSTSSSTQDRTTQNKAVGSKGGPKGTYQEELAGRIQDFYGVWEADKNSSAGADLIAHWNVPSQDRSQVQFAIAIFPDPVHTHLGLFFDRSIEALVQAAQKKRYIFDRAILPWDRLTNPEPSDPNARKAQAAEQAAREAFPGLLIFRQEPDLAEAASPSSTDGAESSPQVGTPLFVFVVGETPTGGLHKEQFRNALKIMREIGGTSPDSKAAPKASAKKQTLILGPSFSGSLESLNQELTEAATQLGETYVYSGTVTTAHSIDWFEAAAPASVHFASFQENDDYALAQFVRFASYRGYGRNQIAVLSEDETAYGAQRILRRKPDSGQSSATRAKKSKGLLPSLISRGASAPAANKNAPAESNDVVQLHFPREISYFRSAYQKETATQQTTAAPKTPGISTLPLDLGESGSDDDSVAPYAGVQTPLSQEAVMLGIVSELQKHHIEFTVLLATDPVDELFLARYLRLAYPQGRVVVMTPDLLFSREEDSVLSGVLGLNIYSLVPGLNDRLCRQKDSFGIHEDRLFVSSSSVGTFNAMAALLSLKEAVATGWTDVPAKSQSEEISKFVPPAPYVEYGTPLTEDSARNQKCEKKPLLWMTILGRDGFWPIVGMSDDGLLSADHQEPISHFPSDRQTPSTLKIASGPLSLPDPKSVTMPGAWSITYCLCLVLLIGHALLSLNGSILADSESRAQFARNVDIRGTIVVGIGALILTTTFVLIMCTRNPLVAWTGGIALTVLMWLPFPLYVAVTIWDIGNLRGQPSVAWAYAVIVFTVTVAQIYLVCTPAERLRVYWSTRVVHITSGVSPVLPLLLLLGAGYWWMWMSLRGISLVDLRRPRLPEKEDLHGFSFRITDAEGEELRMTAHPFFFAWQVLLPVLGLALVSLTVLDLKHPVQTIEGWAYDWGFTLLLGVMIATFLGCLLKLVLAWFKCRQILSGLDRTPLREAFSRMKGLSWHSFWNPGGSTLRETYKVMSRALENLERLDLALQTKEADSPLTDEARNAARAQIKSTFDAKTQTHDAYMEIFAEQNGDAKKGESTQDSPGVAPAAQNAEIKKPNRCEQKEKHALLLKTLMDKVEALQKSMAKTAATLICDVLLPWWSRQQVPVVSVDDRLPKGMLTLTRALAEEFTALVYVNFLVTVLLRMRTLVICAGGMYVFIVLSVSVYPFEPHPALQSLTVILLLVGGAAVGYVYAEMHREAILSRLTSTEAGELGLDFWLKLAAAGAIPVFSLLAAQFPQINQLLFSWLEPALQAMK